MLLRAITFLGLLHYSLSAKLSSSANDRQLSFLNVIQFPDDECTTDNNKKGTCLTAETCTERSGTSSGDCASGYGICCLIELACGDSSSSNITYMSQASNNPERSCQYAICKSKETICRIKFDLETFVIHPPEEGEAGSTARSTTNYGSIGHCENDGFSIASPGNKGSPIICGYNTGQHIIVDAPSSQCVSATFLFGSTTYARSYSIKVYQYQCGSEAGGPSECLQYFTATSGSIANFGFDTSQTDVAATTTHLANQYYNICFRRASKYCALCFWPAITTGTQQSFGLSVSAGGGSGTSATIAHSQISGNCDEDFIAIPYAQGTDITIATNPAISAQGADRHCGRFINQKKGQTASQTVCTGFRPFIVQVKFDDNEEGTDASDANTNEQYLFPGGIVGFYLNWEQKTCT